MGKVWERQIRSAQTILLALMKKRFISLNYESLVTFLIKTEWINNSRLLIVKTISDIGSEASAWKNNLQTMISNVVLPPPDVYSHRKWRSGEEFNTLQVNIGLVGEFFSFFLFLFFVCLFFLFLLCCAEGNGAILKETLKGWRYCFMKNNNT